MAKVARLPVSGGRRALSGKKPLLKEMFVRGLTAVALRYRRLLGRVCVIGITGSAGKTTAKDVLNVILSTRLRGKANRFTYNRLTHILRRLLTTKPSDDFLIQEISVECPGGIDLPLRLLQPKIGLVTCIGFDHYTSFRGMENTAAEKAKLVRSLPPDGCAILNADDPLVLAMREGVTARVMTYGQSSDADLRAEEVSAAWPDRLSFTACHGSDRARVETQLLGAHWLPSILGAVAAGRALDFSLEEMAAAVRGVAPAAGRMSPAILPDGVTFIRDDWKAPLWSVTTVLDFLRQARADRKIVVFGTFSDFPGDRARKYQKAAREALQVADHVVFVGHQAHMVEKVIKEVGPDRLRAFSGLREVHEHLQSMLRSGDLVLLKGSNAADHLVRLVIARETPIACWRARCSRNFFCQRCPLLNKPE
ncbi:MAG: UDP-N-acetylmuramate--L-alanine ligase [Verrucomicrobia bacterium ADurb.Bin345]|nr:MAG: UDP-N-acetylmuramate--L-alanine ligase [Verrucomicrobia bacterium ADurb.Bin345]